MKYYNVDNYVRYKLDLEKELKRIEKDIIIDVNGQVDYTNMDDDHMI